jgi:hypothetical protein
MLSLFCSSTPASIARPADGPEVIIDSTKRDFGDVFAGEELEQSFPIRNAGNKPLELAQKSNLGTRSTSPIYPRAAVWRRADKLLARPVSATRAAPS